MRKMIACHFWNENSYINKKKEKKTLTSTVSSEQLTKGYCRTCSRSFPSSVCPCWIGSGNARYRVLSRQVISLREPLYHSDSIVVLRNSTTKKYLTMTYIYNIGNIIVICV